MIPNNYKPKSPLIDFFYPVGSYYETSNTSFNPNVTWGGVWAEDTKGRILVSQDTAQNEFKTIGQTGGAKTVTLSVANLPVHNHTFTGTAHAHGLNNHTHTYAEANTSTESTTLTVDQIPSHNHDATFGGALVDVRTGTTELAVGKSIPTATTGGTPSSNMNTTSTGGGKGHTHTIKTTSTNTGAASGNTANATATGTIGNTGSGTAVNNLPPYIVIRRWHRTA